MEASILSSIKKTLGLAADYDAFDEDVITYINSAFSTLTQLGIGPADGYIIEDAVAEWDDFTFDGTTAMLSMIKTYISLKVGILFDPPQMGYLVDLKTKQIEQYEWRLTVSREEVLNAG
jgi:hypothetical protein